MGVPVTVTTVSVSKVPAGMVTATTLPTEMVVSSLFVGKSTWVLILAAERLGLADVEGLSVTDGSTEMEGPTEGTKETEGKREREGEIEGWAEMEGT